MEEITEAILKFLGKADWASIVPTALTFLSAIIATIYTYRISEKANNINKDASEVNKRLGELGIDTQDKQRFIGTISVQRVEWINNIRNAFADFNRGAFLYSNLIKKSFHESYEMDTEEINLFPELVYNMNLIELYLNPSEKVSKRLIDILDKAVKYMSKPRKEDYNILRVSEMREQILYLQQVILKAEWKRLKKETEKGKEIDENEMEIIFKDVAKKIDLKLYNHLLKNIFETS
ncbi:hypothetical protein [Planomicrobium okeanokoites]|uniref:hypothetical protein n=1 Tax=Planomicrobium okeanokoites TaxID=244 RepID=UPI000A040D7D|nr:hypothetical protein [Planomicrobium okeanokoites]